MSTSCLERSAGALLLIRSWLEQPQRCSRSKDEPICRPPNAAAKLTGHTEEPMERTKLERRDGQIE